MKAAPVRPRVVVKFRDGVQLPYEDKAEAHVERLDVGPWDRLEEQFPGITLSRLFTSQEPEKIQSLVRRAADRDRSYKPRNLLAYFAIDCPGEVDPEALAKAIGQWRSVEVAYVEGGPTPPPSPVNATNDPRATNQGYLDPAPDGIDAEYAWTLAGGDGAGVGVVDLEQGWTLNHEDLVTQGITMISGTNTAYFGHGTAVLGELVATDNTIGCVGIAPRASARVVSQYRAGGGYNTSEAILDAAAAMPFGDVLLLEAQTSAFGYSMLPVECELAVFDVIRLATALGVVVVEAAGNGGNDLDAVSILGQRVFDRSSADFRDSGAIMVGAGSSLAPHSRLSFSNYGSRIDCYGWGESIDTTGDGWTGNLTTSYTGSFGGTSGASPIVTGAAALVQSLFVAARGYRVGPKQMRVILASAATGTASANPATDRIGVMPDLRSIATTVINAAPDVYVRDFVGDVGNPHAGAASASPDIILRPAAVADPQAAFGEGSGTESSATLGHEAEAGQTNYVYVRMRNRGASPAANVRADLWWSPPSTLVSPNLWTYIGNVTVPSVPVGDVLTVADAIPWPASAIPATGHYCIVGIVGNAQDPAPTQADFLNWDNYVRFIRANNNVAWRNFNVVDNVPPSGGAGGAPPGWIALPFHLAGAPDRARPFAIETHLRLPKGSRALLELTLPVLDSLDERPGEVEIDEKRDVAQIPVAPQGRTRVGEARFPAKSVSAARLLVKLPDHARELPSLAAVSQHWKDLEVGRVTWNLVPAKRGKEPRREPERDARQARPKKA